MFIPTPDQIDMEHHFMDAFDNYEREITAQWIVQLCQEKGDWMPFTKPEIDKYHLSKTGKPFYFNGIVTPEYGIEERGHLFHIGMKFVARLPVQNQEVGDGMVL